MGNGSGAALPKVELVGGRVKVSFRGASVHRRCVSRHAGGPTLLLSWRFLEAQRRRAARVS